MSSPTPKRLMDNNMDGGTRTEQAEFMKHRDNVNGLFGETQLG